MYEVDETTQLSSPMQNIIGLPKDLADTIRVTEAFTKQLAIHTELMKKMLEYTKETRDYFKEAKNGIKEDLTGVVKNVVTGVATDTDKIDTTIDDQMTKLNTTLTTQMTMLNNSVDKLFLRIITSGVVAGLFIAILNILIVLYSKPDFKSEISKIREDIKKELLDETKKAENAQDLRWESFLKEMKSGK